MKKVMVSALVVLSAGVMAHAADKPFDAAAAFGARESLQSISISPDGTKIAYITPTKGQGMAVYVLTPGQTTPPQLAGTSSGDPMSIRSCGWVSNDRLVCLIYGIVPYVDAIHGLVPLTRLLAFDIDGKNVKIVGEHRSAHIYGGGVLDWLPEEDGAVLMQQGHNHEAGLAVDRIDTRTLKATSIESATFNADEYIADGHGNVRIMGNAQSVADGMDNGITQYNYRSPTSRSWLPLGPYNDNDRTGFNPIAVDRDQNLVYGLKKLDGRMALYSIQLDESLKEKLVFAHPEVDVDGVTEIGRQHRVVGVTYTTQTSHTEYFDPKIAQIMTALHKAVPQPLLNVVGASLDENKLLLWAGADNDPGVTYLFDRTTHQLNTFLVVRSELEGVKLATVKPVSYPADDGVSIPGYLTLPPGHDSVKGLPAIVMPHGGPATRDEWQFDYLVQFFANRGYAVLQPNYRGSAGYGDAWFQKSGFASWPRAIGDVVSAGHWLISQGVEPGKLAIFGWSYGGYAALQSSVTEPDLYKAVIAVAPVTDIAALKKDAENYASRSVTRFYGSGAGIHEGSPVEHADRFKAPVLLFHGTLDINVDIEHSKRMAARLKSAGKSVEFITFDKLDHHLDDTDARTQLLRRSDDFLRKTLGL